LNLAAVWLDILLGATVLISMVFGVKRGLMFEMLSAFGCFAAYLAARWLAASLVPYVPDAVAVSGLRYGIAFGAMFVAFLLGWILTSRALRILIRGSSMSNSDRALGAAFGLARGVVLLLAVVTVIRLTPLAETKAWRHSNAVAWLEATLRGLMPVLPSDISRHLPDPEARSSPQAPASPPMTDVTERPLPVLRG
jgi:membrane protein required for colicin V production